MKSKVKQLKRTDWSFKFLKQFPFSHFILNNSQSPKQSHVSTLLQYAKKNLLLFSLLSNIENGVNKLC